MALLLAGVAVGAIAGALLSDRDPTSTVQNTLQQNITATASASCTQSDVQLNEITIENVSANNCTINIDQSIGVTFIKCTSAVSATAMQTALQQTLNQLSTQGLFTPNPKVDTTNAITQASAVSTSNNCTQLLNNTNSLVVENLVINDPPLKPGEASPPCFTANETIADSYMQCILQTITVADQSSDQSTDQKVRTTGLTTGEIVAIVVSIVVVLIVIGLIVYFVKRSGRGGGGGGGSGRSGRGGTGDVIVNASAPPPPPSYSGGVPPPTQYIQYYSNPPIPLLPSYSGGVPTYAAPPTPPTPTPPMYIAPPSGAAPGTYAMVPGA